LDLLTNKVKRVVLIIGDYPNFESGDYSTLRFQAFEIWPSSERQKMFAEIMTNYYRKIYLEHKKQNASSNPAPKNFWPYQYQFYICNPIQTFSCIVKNANKAPAIEIENYIEPDVDREGLPSIIMPIDILKEEEINCIIKQADENVLRRLLAGYKTKKSALGLSLDEKRKFFPDGVPEELRVFLPLRDTDKISTSKSNYSRRGLK
jgi:hypothetical protein